MFKKTQHSMAKVTPSDSAYNKIGAGTVINGDIRSKGDIRIDGTITGSLHVEGKVVVGETGVVEGDVTCQNADVEGLIKAKISVGDLLSLKATAKVLGEIETKKLAVEPGAILSGTCGMGGVVKELKHAEGQKAGKTLAAAEQTA